LTLAPSRSTRDSPYKGLAAYGAEDASFFFGRTREREVLTANLRARRLTLVYGESGVGKSSLLQAGVYSELSRIAAEEAAEGITPELIPVYFASWRDDPALGILEATRASVSALLPDRELPVPGDHGLSKTLAEWATSLGCEFLIILDQFEDYFMYHPQEGGGGFASEFAEAINRPGFPVSFLLAIREDTFAKLDRFKTLIPTLLDNYLRIRHLDDAAAREAIEQPLAVWNEGVADDERIGIDASLVDAVIQEVKGGAAPSGTTGQGVIERNGRSAEEPRVEAPYLQLVLTRMWDEEAREGSHRLRAETLQRLGGAENIVRTHLDEALRELSPLEQDVASAAFYYLVTPEGTKIVQSLQTLAVYSGRSEKELAGVLETLSSGTTRIVRPVAPPPGAPSGPRYEVFHDILAPAILDWRTRHERERLEREKQEAERRRDELERQQREMLRAAERRRRTLLVTVALGAFAIGAGLYAADALKSLELKTVDTRFHIRGTHAVPKDVVIVAVDDKTASDLGKQLPLPRSFHGRVVDRLHRAGAKLIVYDIEFRGQGPRPAEDERLLQGLFRAQPVVLGATATNARGQPDFLGNPAYLREIGARPASALIPPDNVVRKVQYEANRLPTVGVAAAEILAHKKITPADLGGRKFWIDYAGKTGTIPTVSFSQVLRGEIRPQVFRNKVVIIGGTAVVLQDRHATPMGGNLMTGPEIQANAIETARRLAPLRSSGGIGIWLLIALFAVIPPLAGFRMRRLFAAAVTCAVAAAYLIAAQLLFEHGRILPVIYPLLALTIALVGMLLVESLAQSFSAQQGETLQGSSA
jgi:CHASE2 domain-containing sensor protein